jgi:predicted GIY-YIG superfamily endonuclease
MKRFFYVYVLVSETDSSIHYTGMAQELAKRLGDHNRGHCPHTAKFKPWRLKTYVALSDSSRAGALERYLKSASGRAFVKSDFSLVVPLNAFARSEGVPARQSISNHGALQRKFRIEAQNSSDPLPSKTRVCLKEGNFLRS